MPEQKLMLEGEIVTQKILQDLELATCIVCKLRFDLGDDKSLTAIQQDHPILVSAVYSKLQHQPMRKVTDHKALCLQLKPAK